MRIQRGVLNWGVFLLLAGLIPLAVQQRYLDAGTVDQLWRLWPLILVGLGVGLVLARTALGWLGGLIVASTFGLLVGAALAGGIGPTACGFNLGGGAPSGALTTTGGELVDGATVELDVDCGLLKVGTAPDGAWALAYRENESVPQVDRGADRLRIASSEGGFPGRISNWSVTLPAGRMLSLELTANASSASLALPDATLSRVDGTFNAGSFRLDLSGARVGSLALRVNAGSGSLTLPTATLDGRIEVNAGSLEVCAPADVGLRIDTGGALSSTDFAGSGLVLSGSTWQSPGYASATTRIDLTVTANAASVTLRRDGGCS